MTRTATWIGSLILIGTMLAVGIFVYMTVVRPTARACDACGRPIHAETKSVGLVEGREYVFCCPTCGVADHLQSGKRIQMTLLSDYHSARPLRPADAFIVEGSGVNHCMMVRAITDHAKQTIPVDFDRCSPSMISFASRESAEAFAREQGGRVLTFGELEAAYQK